MGQKKSSEFRWLLRHLTIQWLFFAFGLVYFVGPVIAIGFATLNCLAHGVIDWNIWNLYKLSVAKRFPHLQDDPAAAIFYEYWNDHWFYTTIGFDQLLHCLTLIGLFALFI